MRVHEWGLVEALYQPPPLFMGRESRGIRQSPSLTPTSRPLVLWYNYGLKIVGPMEQASQEGKG